MNDPNQPRPTFVGSKRKVTDCGSFLIVTPSISLRILAKLALKEPVCIEIGPQFG